MLNVSLSLFVIAVLMAAPLAVASASAQAQPPANRKSISPWRVGIWSSICLVRSSRGDRSASEALDRKLVVTVEPHHFVHFLLKLQLLLFQSLQELSLFHDNRVGLVEAFADVGWGVKCFSCS